MAQEPDKQETIVQLDVPAGYREGERLDLYVTRSIHNASRTKVQKGIKEGQVTVNGQVVKKGSFKVQPGNVIVCRIKRAPPIEARPEAIRLDIVYEDDYLIVVNKAAGMVVHPAYGNRTGTLVNALLHHVGAGVVSVEEVEDDGENGDIQLSTVNARPNRPEDPSIRPGIVHRLDKYTSGLLVVAKDDVTHRELAEQFFHRTIQRQYLAIVWGAPDPPQGRIVAALGRDPRDRKRMAVVPDDRGKNAITLYETLTYFADTSLVSFRLETGRTHQIRVHAQYINRPVLGDIVYGGQTIRYGLKTSNRRAFYKNIFDILKRQALHAATLGFTHPLTKEDLFFRAPLPDDIQNVVERLSADAETF